MSKVSAGTPPWPIVLAFLGMAIVLYGGLALLLRYVYGWFAAGAEEES